VGDGARAAAAPSGEVPPPADEEGGVVRVVDPDGAAVPGAEASWYTIGVDEALPGEWTHTAAFRLRVVATDEGGELALPERGEWGCTVFARAERDGAPLWGRLWIGAEDEGPHVLALEPDLSLRVQVVDSTGLPAPGPTVVLGDRRTLEQRRGALQARAEGDGAIATFQHLQLSLPEEVREQAAIALWVPMVEWVTVPVDLDPPPAEPVRLVLGPHGSLVVRLVDAEGAPYRPVDRSGPSAEVTIRPAEGSELTRRTGAPGGILDLSFLELDATVRVDLDSEECTGSGTFDGPTYEGERVEATLVVDARPILTGRLVDPGGAPVEHRYWFATHRGRAPGYWNLYIETAEDGSFETPVPRIADETSFEHRTVVFRSTIEEPPEQGFLDLAALDLRPGRNLVGDVVVEPPPLVAGGVAHDDAGAPVAGADVSLYTEEGESRWSVGGVATATTGEDGRFELRGHPSVVTDLLLYARADGHSSGKTPVRLGAEGHRLVLERAGHLEIEVRFDEVLTPDDVLVTLGDRDEGGGEAELARDIEEEGLLRWRDLSPGRYTVELRAIGASTALASFDPVVVVGGETTRLADVDLAGVARVIRVRVEDGKGAPISGATALVNPDARNGAPREVLRATNGVVELRTAEPSVELELAAPGYRSARAAEVYEDTTVVLVPGIRLALTLRVDGELPDGVRLTPRLSPAGEQSYAPQGEYYWPNGPGWMAVYDSGAGRWAEDRAFEGGVLELRVPAPGEYAIEWRVETTSQRRWLHPDPQPRLLVRETADAQVFELGLSAAAVRAALQRH
jgi:hypothetical protein